MRSQKAVALEELMPSRHFSTEAARFQRNGQDLYRQKDFDTAILYFTRALEHKSTAGLDIYDNRSAAYAKMGKLDLALRDGKSMIQKDRSSPLGYLRTGKVLVFQGKEDAAHGIYKYGLEKASAKDPQYQLLRDTYDRLVSRRSPAKAEDPLIRFPTEIVLMILSYIPFRDNVLSLQVSKSWKHLLSHEKSVWAHLDFSSTSKVIRKSTLIEYLRYARRSTTRLTASPKNLGSDRGLYNIASKSDKLVEINILEGPMIGQSLLDATSHLRHLKTLIVRAEISPNAVGQVLLRCANLQRAEFYRVATPARGSMGGRSSIIWSGDLSKLKYLTLDTVPRLQRRETAMLDSELQTLVDKLINIEELKIRNWTILGSACNLSSLKFLRTFDLTDYNSELPILPASLVSLTLNQCRFDFQDYTNSSILEHSEFRELQILRMQNLHYLDDTTLDVLISKTTVLQVLDISNCYEVTGQKITELINNGSLKELVELGLQSTDVDNETVRLLASSLSNLKRLDLSCTKISGLAVAGLVDKSLKMKLEFLGVRYCENVSYESVEFVKQRGIKVDYARHQKEKGAKRIRYY